MATERITKASGSRTYKLEDGTVLPSVTTILGVLGKPALINWAANTERALVIDAAEQLNAELAGSRVPGSVYRSALTERLGLVKAHKRITEQAADIGSQAHARIEWALRRQLGLATDHEEPACCEQAQWAVMAFEDWAKAHDVRPLMTEQIVWSRVHRYAGTLDLVADVAGVRTLIDFKTSKAIYPEAHMQNVAYQVALAEMGHEPCAAGAIVRIPKNMDDPAFEVAQCPPVDALLPTFLHLREVYDWWAEEDRKSAAAWRARRKGAAA